jgi:hypothetical protein
MLKRLNQMNFGYLPPPLYQLTYPCYSGGTTNTTTSWYSALYSATGFPANFWNGALFTYGSAVGATPTTGIITASTSNISTTTGITLTLGTALAAPCTAGTSTANRDILIVRQRNIPVNTVTPADYGLLSSAAFVADTSPASTNTYQSLSLANGQTQNFFIDAAFGTWAPDPSLGSVTWLNINGPYSLTFKAKCTGSAGAVTYSAARIGSAAFVGGTDTLPSCSPTAGSGWQTYTHNFTGTETGSQTETIQLSFSVAATGGNVLLQDMDLIEGSTLPGNTTAFRDDVVRTLQKLNPGSLRLMTPASWPSDEECQTAAIGMQCAAGLKGYAINSVLNSIGYDDFLALCYFLKTTPYITLGHYNTPADHAAFVSWLSTSGWTAKFKALGLKIYDGDGNELWNSGAFGNIDGGNGVTYGTLTGQKAAAFKGASGYDATVNKFVSGNWFAGSQAYFLGGGGWASNVLQYAGCTNVPPTLPNLSCPDAMEIAPYLLNQINVCTSTSGGPCTNLQNDETAEVTNWFMAPCSYLSGCSSASVLATQASLLNQRGVQTTIYEQSYSPSGGSATLSQSQMNQASQSVSMALNVYRSQLSARRDSKVYGPINEFAFVDQPYNGGCCGTQQTSWTAEAYMACGPGQLSSCTSVGRAIGIIMQVGNTAIGNNSSLINCAQSGTPTLNYPGGQSGQVAANAAVPLVDVFCYTDGAGHFTILAFNMSLNSQTLNFAGAGTPSGTVTKTVFGGPLNGLYDTNVDSLSQNSPAAVIAVPSPTTLTSPASDTLPAGSMTTYTYTVGGTPQAGTPTFTPPAGSYSGAQSVTLSNPSSAPLVCYNNTGAAIAIGGATSCPAGSTHYTSAISVASSQTLYAVAGGTGFLDSTTNSAAYSITVPTAATPTFSVPGGTYTTAQSVSLASTTPGATIYYTTNGTTPTTGSTVYSGPIVVNTTTTLKAIAVATGFTNSAVASATYTITVPVAATPVISPASGTYTSSANISMTDLTGSASIYYTQDGSTPTSGSTLYSGPFSITTSQTIKAIAIATGYTNSAVATSVYTIVPPVVANPTITPNGGPQTGPVGVTLASATSGAGFCYTSDLSTPVPDGSGGCSHGTLYTSLTVSSTLTLKVIAFKTGYTNSGVVTSNQFVFTGTAGVRVLGNVKAKGNVVIK